MNSVIVDKRKAQEIALEQLAQREAELLKKEMEGGKWTHATDEEKDAYFEIEIDKAIRWKDYLDQKRRDKNTTGLPLNPNPLPEPKFPPFPRVMEELISDVIKQMTCSDEEKILIELGVIATLEKSIGVELGSYGKHRHSVLKGLRDEAPAATDDDDGDGDGDGDGGGGTGAGDNGAPPTAARPDGPTGSKGP